MNRALHGLISANGEQLESSTDTGFSLAKKDVELVSFGRARAANPVSKDSVHFRLVKDFPTATLAHRLDFGKSGFMFVALNKEINGHLTKHFQQRTVVKRVTKLYLWSP